MNHNLILNEYFVAYLTVKRIWIEKWDEVLKLDQQWQSIRWSKEYTNIVEEYIRNFCRTTNSTFVVMDIMKRIMHDLNILVEWRDIRAILKDKLKLSFKKWSSMPANIDSFRFILIRTLHSLEFIIRKHSYWKINLLKQLLNIIKF